MTTTYDIVARLWSLCHVLRDDGITFHQYVTELTYLLFLKMAQETNTEHQLPEGWRWRDLESKDGVGPDALPKLTIMPSGRRQSSDRSKVACPTES